MTAAVPYLDAAAVFAALSPRDAVEALAAALRDGLDPAADLPRPSVALDHGQLLLMPATSASAAGVKLVTVAPDNAARGLPTIQGAYVLFDHVTLSPVAILDGSALTALRTPAVSVAAVRDALDAVEPTTLQVVVFGAGPQGVGHVRTLRSVYGERIGAVTYAVRAPDRVDRSELGGDHVVSVANAAEALRQADVVVCATTSRTPVFAAGDVRDGAVVMAVGSHQPDVREVDAALLSAAEVVVEDVGTALREAGDVVLAIAEGALSATDLITMRDVVTGQRALELGRTVVFKSTGMSWEDLVVAQAVARGVG
jgi:ornithine cyclodeaminase/alanine dehydrogenase-like protein (mu-crystallin family)